MKDNFWFISNGYFGSLCLENLLKNNWIPKLIVTKQNSFVDYKSKDNGINKYYVKDKIYKDEELIGNLYNFNPKLIIVVDFGQIIKDPFLKYFCIGIHPSLLPLYRGPNPIVSNILDTKNNVGGVTVYRLSSGIDNGNIIGQKEIYELDNQTYNSVAEYASEYGVNIITKMPSLNEILFKLQDNSKATYTSKINLEDRYVSFKNNTAKEILRRVNAFSGYKEAYCIFKNKKIKLYNVRRLYQKLEDKKAGYIEDFKYMGLKNIKPGIVCKDKEILILEKLQPEGKKVLSSLDWINGFRYTKEDLFE